MANYFDKSLALEFELDGESCVICTNVIYLESARRFIEQKKKDEGVEGS